LRPLGGSDEPNKTKYPPEPRSGHGRAPHEKPFNLSRRRASRARQSIRTRGTLLLRRIAFNMEPSTPHAPTAVGRSCSNMRPMTATVRTGHTSVIFSAVRRAIFYVILERFSVRSFRLGCFLHWRSLGAIHRRNLETGPRHRPRRSWRPSPYGGKALGRVTFTADGRMMSVVCDAGKSCRPECAGNIAPTAATTPVMARSLSPRLTRPQTRAVDTWGRFLFRVGSRSAPIETPTSGVFSGDFSYLLQFWPGSQFGA